MQLLQAAPSTAEHLLHRPASPLHLLPSPASVCCPYCSACEICCGGARGATAAEGGGEDRAVVEGASRSTRKRRGGSIQVLRTIEREPTKQQQREQGAASRGGDHSDERSRAAARREDAYDAHSYRRCTRSSARSENADADCVCSRRLTAAQCCACGSSAAARRCKGTGSSRACGRVRTPDPCSPCINQSRSAGAQDPRGGQRDDAATFERRQARLHARARPSTIDDQRAELKQWADG